MCSRSSRSFPSYISILFTAKISPFLCSKMYSLTWQSCLVTPSVASIKSTQISACSTDCMERMMLYFSRPGSTFPRRRIPAVSIKVNGVSLYSKGIEVESRVVPAISETTTIFFPNSAFTIVDFPTFGRPKKAIFIRLSSIAST